MTQASSILIVSNHPVVRIGITCMLNSKPEFKVVGEAGDHMGAIQKAATLYPDIVIMDVTTPEIDWEKTIATIKACLRDARIIVCSLQEDRQVRFDKKKTGNVDYLPYNFNYAHILEVMKHPLVR
jgi:DNA-binding NarL/FixJ family response regulator